MKKLLLVRHAKSSWDSPTLKDFDRSLNERGEQEAAAMAKKLFAQKIPIDAFLTSTALRARTTAGYFAKAYSLPEKKMILVDELYHAPANVFYNLINQLDDEWETVIFFAHNPGITDMVNSLGVARLDDMPTCGIFGVSAETKAWKDFKAAEKRFLLFDYPKK
jgi:phosphohistidine phosphatase